jgi:hypothetical protein
MATDRKWKPRQKLYRILGPQINWKNTFCFWVGNRSPSSSCSVSERFRIMTFCGKVDLKALRQMYYHALINTSNVVLSYEAFGW